MFRQLFMFSLRARHRHSVRQVALRLVIPVDMAVGVVAFAHWELLRSFIEVHAMIITHDRVRIIPDSQSSDSQHRDTTIAE